ncbi:MAG: dihydrofolate reductase family protein [Clostridiaceae bacterium]
MDGKIAAYTGKSRWVTGEEARAHVQTKGIAIRGSWQVWVAVLTGRPASYLSYGRRENPVRASSATRQTADTAGFSDCKDSGQSANNSWRPVWRTMNTEHTGLMKKQAAELCGWRRTSHVDSEVNVSSTGSEGIDSILLEGGETLNWSR